MTHRTYNRPPVSPSPGLRVRDERPSSRGDQQVRMDVAGFVGLAERGPVCVPVVIESWAEFRSRFGRAGRARRLPYAVRQFFANGGRRCVVVRALHYPEARTAWGEIECIEVVGPGGVARNLKVYARSPGSWGNRVRGKLTFGHSPVSVRPTLEPDVLTTHAPLVTGDHLRITRRDPATMRMESQYVWVTQVEDGGGTRRLTLSDSLQTIGWTPNAGQPRLDATVEQAWADLEVGVDDQRETWTELGFRPEHPRHLVDFVNANSRLLRFRQAPATAPLTPDRDESAFFELGDAERWGDDSVGDDAHRHTTRRDFFRGPARWPYIDPVPVTQLVDQRPLQALVDYDETGEPGEAGDADHLMQPVSVVNFPDLVHPEGVPREPGPDPSSTADPEDVLRFGQCAQPARTETVYYGTPYPNLSIDHDLPGALDAMAELVNWCEEIGQKIAILDLPPGLGSGAIVQWHRALESRQAALYGPFLRVPAAETAGDGLVTVGAGPAICGVIARVEATDGIGAAPANVELRNVVERFKDGAMPHERFLFEERVNFIRSTARGLRPMGSRTTGGDVDTGHLSVQRVLHFLQRQLPVDTRWALFEPNNRRLWRRLRRTIETRLNGLFTQHALSGHSVSEAYFVRCDASLNDATRRKAGRVVAEIGVAVAVPTEFIEVALILQSQAARVEVRNG